LLLSQVCNVVDVVVGLHVPHDTSGGGRGINTICAGNTKS